MCPRTFGLWTRPCYLSLGGKRNSLPSLMSHFNVQKKNRNEKYKGITTKISEAKREANNDFLKWFFILLQKKNAFSQDRFCTFESKRFGTRKWPIRHFHISRNEPYLPRPPPPTPCTLPLDPPLQLKPTLKVDFYCCVNFTWVWVWTKKWSLPQCSY